MIVIWVIAIFLALYLLTQTDGFVQQYPLELSPGNKNMQDFSKILSSCGNVDIPWYACSDAFEGLPWQFSSMFEQNVRKRMCNADGTINRQEMNKYISCPK